MRNTTSHMSKSTAAASLKRLKMIIRPTEGDWTAVERRFDMMTKNTGGLLTCSKFCECIGINSKEFALELFYALAFGKTKIADKDDDGRLTKDEVREFISLIASANNMSTIKNKADEYAAQIMDEFDPDEFEYITELETQCVTSTEETEKPTMLKRWNKVIEAISSSSLTIIDVEIVKQDLR
ncbi:hypothetical protein ARALYDRAFT_344663 [Arabidopsis lyrata subsp. lyrata]|uniref:EF-hand domain-containing protein n=1 Tax=Arabidopsis lyrata subsp. lyrata TaxID=81972 RepID=D7LK88_ARALL|nr:hypothetical protein ARALYDRAFT_344663 [Arabidopsis lyrata subsp. lyrata]